MSNFSLFHEGPNIQQKYTYGLESACMALHLSASSRASWTKSYMWKLFMKHFCHTFTLLFLRLILIDLCRTMTRNMRPDMLKTSWPTAMSTGGKLLQSHPIWIQLKTYGMNLKNTFAENAALAWMCMPVPNNLACMAFPLVACDMFWLALQVIPAC